MQLLQINMIIVTSCCGSSSCTGNVLSPILAAKISPIGLKVMSHPDPTSLKT
jgi:hypothetical protein